MAASLECGDGALANEEPTTTLADVCNIAGVGSLLVSNVPLVDRLLLRLVCKSLYRAVDESLKSIEAVSRDEFGSKSVGKALLWLASFCRNLRSCDLRPYKYHDPERELERNGRPLWAWEDPGPEEECRRYYGIQHRTSPGLHDGVITILAERCKSLSHLVLSNCPELTDVSLDVIADCCVNLTTLDVSDTLLSDRGISAIAAGCPLLTSLDVSRCRNVTDKSLSDVGQKCKGLQRLCVAGWQRPLAHIHGAYLIDSDVSDKSLTVIAANCADLRHLAVVNCRQVSDATLAALGAHSPHLEHLVVAEMFGRVTDGGIKVVAEGCPALLTLDATNSHEGVTDGALLALAQHCPGLRKLHVGGCSGVTSAGIEALARGCRQLEDLSVGGGVTDEGIMAVAVHCGASLMSLEIKDCVDVGDRSIILVARNCPRLRSLHVEMMSDDTREFTDASMAAIGDGCPQLRHLKLYCSVAVTEEGVVMVRRACRQLAFCEVERFESDFLTDD
eukprot:jgi/Mesvir1/13780/Mv15949-RA.1